MIQGVRALAADSHGGDAAAGRFGSVSRALAIQPLWLPVLVVFAVAYTGMLGAVVFLGIRIVELGGQPSDVALTFGIAAFAEITGWSWPAGSSGTSASGGWCW